MMMADATTLAKKASLLHLSALSLAEGMRSASFRSFYHGHGIAFSGVREYLHGDDVRAIDWNVTARMGRPFVKIFEEERELNVLLVLDISLSMTAGTGARSRLEKACECAGLITLASFQNVSPVGAVIFDGKISFSCAPRHGREQMLLLLSKFERPASSGVVGSALDSALQGAGKLLKKRSLIMIFSDFRAADWYVPFGRLAQRHDVVAVRLVDPLDKRLPAIGSVPFCDSEAGYKCVLPTSSVAFQAAWLADHERRLDAWQRECVRHGGIPLVMNTEADSLVELSRFFVSRKQR